MKPVAHPTANAKPTLNVINNSAIALSIYCTVVRPLRYRYRTDHSSVVGVFKKLRRRGTEISNAVPACCTSSTGTVLYRTVPVCLRGCCPASNAGVRHAFSRAMRPLDKVKGLQLHQASQTVRYGTSKKTVLRSMHVLRPIVLNFG